MNLENLLPIFWPKFRVCYIVPKSFRRMLECLSLECICDDYKCRLAQCLSSSRAIGSPRRATALEDFQYRESVHTEREREKLAVKLQLVYEPHRREVPRSNIDEQHTDEPYRQAEEQCQTQKLGVTDRSPCESHTIGSSVHSVFSMTEIALRSSSFEPATSEKRRWRGREIKQQQSDCRILG